MAPLRMSIAGLTAVRLPVLLGRCVALLLRCRPPPGTTLGCSRGCSSGSCCPTPGAEGEGLEGLSAPPSLLVLRCIIYCTFLAYQQQLISQEKICCLPVWYVGLREDNKKSLLNSVDADATAFALTGAG